MNNDRFKFRVWDKENECYQQDEADHCVINHKGELVCVFWGDGDTMQTQYVESKIVIEQCTGLKDKNGKLIFEGDILLDGGGFKQSVFFDDGFASFDWGLETCEYPEPDPIPFNKGQMCRVEIIGNIHEEAKESEAGNA